MTPKKSALSVSMRKYKRTCVVKVSLNDAQNHLRTSNNAEVPETSCSGIIVDDNRGIILTHGLVLLAFLPNIEHLVKLTPNEMLSSTILQALHNFVKIELLLEKGNNKFPKAKQSLFDCIPSNSSQKMQAIPTHKLETIERETCKSYSAKLLRMKKVDDLEKEFKKVLPESEGWTFTENTEKNINNNNVPSWYTYLPYFLLLQIEEWYDNCLERLNIYPSQNLTIGEDLYAVATPFGTNAPRVFMNSMSKGILSNVSGGNNVLLLTDVRCISGTEGGALYVRKSNESWVAGVIVAPFCWKEGEWIGLTLGCGLDCIMQSFSLDLVPVADDWFSESNYSNGLNHNMEHVACVTCGSSWGSGILIPGKKPIVLTCSHVVRYEVTNAVVVQLCDKTEGTWKTHKARVLYAAPEEAVFDVAVLRVLVHCRVNEKLMNVVRVQEGASCFIIGYPLFNSDTMRRPTVTSGIISKLITYDGIPVMIQTSCAVHAGASGGPIVNKYGDLVGMVTSNAKNLDSGAYFPAVNMALPLATIWPVLQAFLHTEDVSILKHLELSNTKIKELWSLRDTENYFQSKL